MAKLSWSMQDDSTIVAIGSAGVGYVITAGGSDDEPTYELALPAGSYSSTSIVRLMLDAQEIEDHYAARQVAA